MKFSAICMFCLLFTSCKLILGIKDPKHKTADELNRFLIRNDLDTLNNFAFIKPCFDSVQKLSFKPKWPVGFRPIQFKVFNSQGKMVSQYASCEGSWKKRRVFESFPPRNIWPIDTSQSYSNDIKMYGTFDGKEIKTDCLEYDLTFVVYWGTWLGVIDKNMMKEVYYYANRYSNKRINILKVNVDEIYSQKK